METENCNVSAMLHSAEGRHFRPGRRPGELRELKSAGDTIDLIEKKLAAK